MFDRGVSLAAWLIATGMILLLAYGDTLGGWLYGVLHQ